MNKKFEEELKNIKIEDIVKYINDIAGYEMLNNAFGYNTLPKSFEKKIYNYETKYVQKQNNYGYWEIKWNKKWDKYDGISIYLNQLRFSIFDYELFIDDSFNETQKAQLKKDIKRYFRYMCPSYVDAVKEMFNKKREEIDKQEEDFLLDK